ncbi:MAG TPA: EVE domain-containing protein [Gemmatimonadales bacterium]|nr:EVE domain-containing protein [Gemmatimonadales bacterium]
MSSSWLLKTEPTTYSYDQLEKEGRTTWDGVRNNLALAHLRAMKTGDRLLIYHTGTEKAVIGLAKVAQAAYPDPKQDDPKLVVVDVVPERRLERPVTLAEVKAEVSLKDLALVRMGRLSVMPVTPAQWKRLLEMGGSAGGK